MKPVEHIEKRLNKMDIVPDAQMDRQTLKDILRAQEQNKTNNPDYGQKSIWRSIMKSKVTKFAAAAGIVIAVLVGIHIPGSSNGRAFANVIDRIYEANSVRYKWTVQHENHEFSSTVMMNRLGIQRSEMQHGDILLFDFGTGDHLHLMAQAKRAVLTHRIGASLKKHPFSYLDWIREIHKNDAEYEGQEECEGKKYDLYTISAPYEKTIIRIDPQTDLPVRIVMEFYPNDDTSIQMPKMELSSKEFGGENMTRSISIRSGRGDPHGIQERQTVIYSDFEWNSELEDALFAFTAPDDYTWEEEQFDVTQKGKDWLIEALAFWAEMSEGRFPDQINDLGDPEKAKPLLIRKFNKDSEPEEELEQACTQMNGLLNAMYFAQERKAENNWYYTGKEVSLNDPITPLCWWKEGDSDEYTVIFSNLSTGTCTEEELTQ